MHSRSARLALLLSIPLAGCVQPARLVPSDAERVLTGVSVTAPNPGLRGALEVRRFVYGSGTDRRRAIFRDSVLVRTRAVNATPFLRGIDRGALKKRWKYWGFDEKALPLNGRVWYPVGDGPFPLVLIVHGNHDMRAYSDPGYAYLGEHFASRGFITVSVDENFLNGGIRSENDARGWMLLKHLQAWRAMESDAAFPLAGKVDWQRIALIGHSRGGDAVAIASGFNRLARYPDDARVTFDFGFAIRTVIAIAPVDGQYRPADRLPPVRGVNYFVIHGSHDADVSTFIGQRTYLRADVAEPGRVKAALYVYRANHGQFNTVWGGNDVGSAGWLLNKRSLLTGEQQRDIGRIFFTGFLELTLRGERAYEPMFRDHRTVGGWLPKTMYISEFASGDERLLATFEEDIDVTTATAVGARVAGHQLSTWREGTIATRVAERGASYESNAVFLGWSVPRDAARPDAATGDSTRGAPQDRAWYEVQIPDGAPGAIGLSERSSLVFGIVDLGQKPSPLVAADTASPVASTPKRDPAAAASQRRRADSLRQVEKSKPKPPPTLKRAGPLPADSVRVDLTVELITADGRRASLPLSAAVALRPPLTIRLYKYKYVEDKLTGQPRDHEYVLQHVEIPFSRFVAALPGLTPADVRAVRFRFDRTPTGTILLDDIGFEPHP